MPHTIGIVASVLVYIWAVEGRAPRPLVLVPAAIVVVLTAVHDWRHKEWGFDPAVLGRGLFATMKATLPLCVLILAAGAVAGTLHDRRDFLGSLAPLVVWGGAQQWVLQTVVLREAQRATSRATGQVVAALLFGGIHLPNPFLAPVTAAAALLWCRIYDRFPNILPLALSHGLGTLVIRYAFNDEITGRLRIGMSYLRLD